MRMKKHETAITIAIITLIATLIMNIPVFATTSREYMTVTSVERESGYVTVLDRKGNLWMFTGYGFQTDDIVIVDMYDNGTETVYDDIIVGVKKVR